MPVWLGVALGGALGALARWGLTLWIQSRLTPTGWASFPLATLAINVTGAFLLAFAITLSARGLLSPQLRLAFGTGFVGAYTTFSTFEWESYGLLGRPVWFWLYVLGNLLLGFAAVLLGRVLAERLAA